MMSTACVDRQWSVGDDFSHCGQRNLHKKARFWVRLKEPAKKTTKKRSPWVERTANIIPKAGKNLATSRNWKADMRLPTQRGAGWEGVWDRRWNHKSKQNTEYTGTCGL